MDNKTLIGIAIVLFAAVVTAVSQVMLKTAAGKRRDIWWKNYLNPVVITAYVLFLATTLLMVSALRFIPLSLSMAVGASTQITVPLAGKLFLKEKISRRKALGMLIIVAGVAIFAL